jgi:multiple sugar transport system ATP-binding protein
VLQQVGEPHYVYSNPKNLFVAQFIGSPGMNFLDCKAETDGSGNIHLKMTADGTVITIPQEYQALIKEHKNGSKDLVLGVRPEDVQIALQKQDNHIGTTVYAVEKMGSYNIVDIKYEDELVRVRTLPHTVLDYEQNVFATFDMERIRLFDKETEESLMPVT